VPKEGAAIVRNPSMNLLCPDCLSAVSEARAGKLQARARCGCALSIQRLAL